MPDDYIFINSNGNPYNSSTFSKRINTIYSNCGFSDSYITGTHILRRTLPQTSMKRVQMLSQLLHILEIVFRRLMKSTLTIVIMY